MQSKHILMISGLLVAIIFVAFGTFLFSFANETLDVIAAVFGAPEWELWLPPLPDYGIPGFENNPLANFILGVGFAALILILTFSIMWLITRRRSVPESSDGS